MKRLFLLLLICQGSQQAFGQCQYGDPCMVADSGCFDAAYPAINHWVTAGVTGGIPENLTIVNTLNPGDDLQAAIDNANTSGGGVVLLNAGIYAIGTTLNMRSNVVLRGVDSASVRLESTIRSTWAQGKKNTIQFVGVTNAGLEDLTIYYRVDGNEPIDRPGLQNGGYCDSCFQNDPHGANNLYVRQVEINVGSSNCWLDGCQILKSGTDPVYIRGNHNTVRNCSVDRSYNKGGSGNGYVDIRGDYNLFVGNSIRRIRHFTLHLGAQYNVVFENYLEVDVNFHNGDAGSNLIEQNTVYIPSWRGWDVFSPGAAGLHAPPGPGNIMVNNDTDYRWFGPRYNGQDNIYTFDTLAPPVLTTWTMPPCGTFYPMIIADPLPVEWLAFDVELLDERHVQLSWMPSSQTNNDYFTIEKSENGYDWISLGNVKGAGTTAELLSYQFADDNPFEGINYYRIKQTDFNGDYSYSDYRSIHVSTMGTSVVYPNPTSGTCYIRAKDVDLSDIRLRNSQGQEMDVQPVLFSDGVIQFDCAEMSAGIYFVELRKQQQTELLKLIVEE